MSHQPEDHLSLERLLLFSDAIFAIAITLLVLELKVPVLNKGVGESGLGQALAEMIPAMIGFVLSFVLIGQTWIEHHRIGGFLIGADRGLLWWNLMHLMFVVIMPFTTSLVSEYPTSAIALELYATGFGLLGVCKIGLWRHVKAKGLIHGDKREVKEIGRRVWASPLVSAAVVILAMIGMPYAYCVFLVIPIVARLLMLRLH